MSDDRQFAYSCDTIDGTECPATQAGFEPSSGDRSTLIALEYDEVVHKLGLIDKSCIIPEKDAKKAWLQALENFEHDDSVVDTDTETAREIADDLGWL